MSKSFVVSTEEVNTQRLLIRSAGGDFAAFNRNPIMLYNHEEDSVIGRWENVRVEGTEVLADPVFDMEDEEAAKIAGKVERGFVRAASTSIRPRAGREINQGDKRIIEITDWELREISIVSIPSNRSALRLLDANDNEITLKEVVELSDIIQGGSPVIITNPQKSMDAKDVAKALGLAETASEAEVTVALNDAVKAKGELDTLKKELEQEQTARATKMVEDAIKSGKIAVTLKDHYLKIAKSNFVSFEAIMGGLSAPVKLADVAKQGSVVANLSEEEELIKLYDSHDKKGTLARIKSENPEEFARMFKAKFGKEPSK